MTFNEWRATLPADRLELWGVVAGNDPMDFLVFGHRNGIQSDAICITQEYETAITALSIAEMVTGLPAFDFVACIGQEFDEVPNGGG